MANLQIGAFKEGKVYETIFALQAEPSSHGKDIFYLFVDAQVNWGNGEEQFSKHIYTMLIQYSELLGQNVDLQQPAHLLLEDSVEVSGKFHLFIRARNEFWATQNQI